MIQGSVFNDKHARRRTMLRKLGPTGVLGLCWTAMPPIFGILLLAYLGAISDWLTESPVRGLLVYVTVFVVLGGFGLLPTYAQTLLGGWVFGQWLGFVAALTGFTGAAILGYTVARLVSRNRIERLIQSHRRARVIHSSLVRSGFRRTLLVVSLLRLPPNSPFALTNLLMASVGIHALPYIVGTALGIAPRAAIAVSIAAAGQATGSRDLPELARNAGLPVILAGILGMLLALAVLWVIARRGLRKLQCDTTDDDYNRLQ